MKNNLFIIFDLILTNDFFISVQKLFGFIFLSIFRIIEFSMNTVWFFLFIWCSTRFLWWWDLWSFYVKVFWFLFNVQMLDCTFCSIKKHDLKISFSNKVKIPNLFTLSNKYSSIRDDMLGQCRKQRCNIHFGGIFKNRSLH